MTSQWGMLPRNASVKATPFKIQVSDGAIRELKTLVEYAKIGPKTYENLQEDRKYGITHEWLSTAKTHWLNEFDWRKHEEQINSYPQFKIEIPDYGQSFSVHFIALFSEREDAVPWILMHGDIYTATLPYHVIVPSLPGYGFSSGPPLDKNFTMKDVARILDKTMVSLGLNDYLAQGGDVGGFLARMIAVKYSSCKACHLNLGGVPPPAGVNPMTDPNLNDQHRQGFARAAWFRTVGSAYSQEHATRPATIGLVLSSSPIALLAWIGEKWLDWTDEDPSLDLILESVSLYWLTDSFPRSLYPYREIVNPELKRPFHADPQWHITKPLGYSEFPKEIVPCPASWVATTGNMVFSRQHCAGGHFAAMEVPGALLEDLEEFVKQVWNKEKL